MEDSAGFLDDAGERLFVTVENAGTAFSTNGWRIREPESPVLMLPESATTVVWSKDGEELGRKAIALEPGRERVTTLLVGR